MTKRERPPARAALRSAFYRIGNDTFGGHVIDECDLTQRFVVELFVDGLPYKLARADTYIHELSVAAVGDGCYGFTFSLPEHVLDDAYIAEARLANVGTPLASPILLRDANVTMPDPRGPGSVRWLGGLRFEGWCQCDSPQGLRVTAVIGGENVAQTSATRWMNVGTADEPAAMRAFDIHLPERFADGCVHRVRFVREDGGDLPPGAVPFVAFPDGLQSTIAGFADLDSERLRGELLDRLLPMAMPFQEYDRWRRRFPTVPHLRTSAPCAIVLTGVGDEQVTLESIECQAYSDWVIAALPEDEGFGAFNTSLLSEFLLQDAAHCECIIFALRGTRFDRTSLQRFADVFDQFPAACAAYGDIEIEMTDGTCWPLAFPAFDYERVLEQGYAAHLFALRRKDAVASLAGRPSNLYRLFNCLLDGADNGAQIVHIPGSVGTIPPLDLTSATRALMRATGEHLQARKTAATITAGQGSLLPSVHVLRKARQKTVSIIIPVRNRRSLLETCLESIAPAMAAARADLIIVDNDSTDPDMLDYLDRIDRDRALVLRVPGPFNFAKLNNIAAEKSDSEYLCLLNNDVKAMDDHWLREMLSRIAEPDVGAVGALLLWPSGVIQHGGVVLGANFAATHAFNDRVHGDPGYADMLRVAREVSCVTAACLLTRRRDYTAVGGMDILRFPVNFNDVDYCLKLRATGKRIVFTPHARLLHLESASRGADRAPDRAARLERELRALRARWGESLVNDLYYNPLLSLDSIPFSALAWPPRDRSARLNRPPKPTDVPPGF
jgi:GT2 family glycosyltransferase